MFERLGLGFEAQIEHLLSQPARDKAPLYRYLTEESTDLRFSGEIWWNFTKFLIGRDGKIVGRFGPRTSPEEPQVAAAIEAALAKPRV